MNRIEELEAEVSRLQKRIGELDDLVGDIREVAAAEHARAAELEEALQHERLRLVLTIAEIKSIEDNGSRLCTLFSDQWDEYIRRIERGYGKDIFSGDAYRRARAVLEGDAPKLPDEIESYFRRTLADPAMKRDVKEFVKATRPTAEDMSRRIGDAPKEEHPIDKANREADEYRRRLQKEFEAANKDCPDCGDRDCGEITCPRWRERLARYLGER